jgi:hypothetical protein
MKYPENSMGYITFTRCEILLVISQGEETRLTFLATELTLYILIKAVCA